MITHVIPNCSTNVIRLNDCTNVVDVFVPYCNDVEEAIDVATSYYPLDWNESTGAYTRIDGANEHSTGYIVTIRFGYDY